MRFYNEENIEIVSSFIRLYGDVLEKIASHYDGDVIFKSLPESENQYHDIMGRLGNTVYISEKEVGRLGLTPPEIFAVLAHEIGHMVYHTRGWDWDCEQRADSLAADLGLGNQMISALEKIIESRRYQKLTSLLVSRIHFLQNVMRG